MNICVVFGPILHRLWSVSIWFIVRLLRAYHRTHTCLGLRLFLLGNNGVGETPPCYSGYD